MTNETFKIAGQDLEFARQFCYLDRPVGSNFTLGGGG